MKCLTECFLATAFIGASIFTMTSSKASSSYKKLYNSFNKEKKAAFKKIKKERIKIWIKASLLALFVSITFSKYKKHLFGTETAFNKSCINTLVFYGVQHLTYSLHPKSDWMLNYVENNTQAKAWLEKYQIMKNRWHTGFALGLVGYFLMNLTIFKNKRT